MKTKRFLLQDKRAINVVVDKEPIIFVPFKYPSMMRVFYQIGMAFSKN